MHTTERGNRLGTVQMVAVTPVLNDQVDGFEGWVREILVPASEAAGTRQHWQLLRTDERDDAATTFLFLFDSDDTGRFDIEAELKSFYQSAAADQHLARLNTLLAGPQMIWKCARIG